MKEAEVVDTDKVINNTVLHLNHSKHINGDYRFVEVSDNRRPTFGVLTEPLRGNMAQLNGELVKEELSYIPKAHVQFLEQSGVRVVPISFLDTDEEIISLLEQVNGVYLPGDSQKSIVNSRY